MSRSERLILEVLAKENKGLGLHKWRITKALLSEISESSITLGLRHLKMLNLISGKQGFHRLTSEGSKIIKEKEIK